jgi:chromosome segregation protein
VLDNFEGMPEGIGFLEKQKNGKSGLGCMTDLLSLEGSYKKAVNAALGESMSYYVCQSLSEAKEGIENLRISNKGKVNFLVLDLVAPATEGYYPDISGAKKTLEVITYPPELHDALLLLLNKSYIVPDLRTAETLALVNRDCSFITIEGETFSGKGLLFGGSSKSNEGLRLGKKAERAMLQKELASLEKTIKEEEEILLQLRHKLASCKVAEQRRDIEQLTTELGGLEKRFARFDAEQSERKQDEVRTGEEITVILQQKNVCEKELDALLPLLSMSASKSTLFGNKIRQMQENLTTLEASHHQFGLEVQASQSRYKDSLLELEKIRITITACTENRQSLHIEIKKMNSDIETAEIKKQSCHDALKKIKEELDTMLIAAAEEQKAVNELESAYREHQARHHESQASLRDLRR